MPLPVVLPCTKQWKLHILHWGLHVACPLSRVRFDSCVSAQAITTIASLPWMGCIQVGDFKRGERVDLCFVAWIIWQKYSIVDSTYCSFLVFSERMVTCLWRLTVKSQDHALQMTWGFLSFDQCFQCLEMIGIGFPKLDVEQLLNLWCRSEHVSSPGWRHCTQRGVRCWCP